jgi:serine phosphatase RsbU (regulator of sigma subunit)
LSDNHGVRLSLKTINDELKRLGSGAVLTKADGYFYFQGGDATDWLDRAVSVPTLRSLTLEQWIGHYRELKAKNEALLKVKLNSKDFETRRAQRVAEDSGAERPRAANAVKQRVAGNSVARRVPQTPKEKSKPETYLRLHHVPIFVHDQDRSLRFYLGQLGFRLIMDYNYGERGRFVLVAPPNGATLLALIAPKPDSADYKFIGRSGQAVFVTEDVASKFRSLRKRGVRFHHPPRTGTWGGIFTTFEDVDGNSFVLAGWNDMTRQIEARRRAMTEKAESERRAAQELEIAKQVQARLFPQTAPTLKTLEYAGVCVQAREVGGDYYDFLNLGPQRLGLVIGDIAGKGIAAALLMANLQANLRSQCAMASDQPERFLRSVNRLFYDNTIESAYATLFFAEYDDTERRLRYSNCGHLAPLLMRRDGTVERLNSTSTVVGVFKEWDCSMTECRLFSGDTLVLYTDGVTESFNEAWEDFGEQRLIDGLETYRKLPPQAAIAAIVNRVKQFSPREQHDDITLIVAKCRGD